MINEFGAELRNIRKQRSLLLLDMANKLNVSSAYLSAIENSKKNIPDDFVERIVKAYGLDEFTQRRLEDAVATTKSSITISVGKLTNKQRDIALRFARVFESLDDDELENLKKFIERGENEL